MSSNSNSLTPREVQIIQSIAQELRVRSKEYSSFAVQEAFDLYADNLLDRLDRYQKKDYGMTFSQWIKILVAGRIRAIGTNLVLWKGEQNDKTTGTS